MRRGHVPRPRRWQTPRLARDAIQARKLHICRLCHQRTPLYVAPSVRPTAGDASVAVRNLSALDTVQSLTEWVKELNNDGAQVRRYRVRRSMRSICPTKVLAYDGEGMATDGKGSDSQRGRCALRCREGAAQKDETKKDGLEHCEAHCGGVRAPNEGRRRQGNADPTADSAYREDNAAADRVRHRPPGASRVLGGFVSFRLAGRLSRESATSTRDGRHRI